MIFHFCSANAHSWLTGLNSGLHNGTEDAGILGSESKNCELIYPCKHTPKSYRFINHHHYYLYLTLIQILISRFRKPRLIG